MRLFALGVVSSGGGFVFELSVLRVVAVGVWLFGYCSCMCGCVGASRR